MKFHAFILSILLLSIVSEVEPKSVTTSCSIECTENNHFTYSEGYDYLYSYEADVANSFHTNAADDQKTQLRIHADAIIRVKSKCELQLLFDDVTISNENPTEEEEWRRAITRNVLHFSWQDGRITDVCSDDEKWVLNFKRGFLSALQTSSLKNDSSVKEIDVSGECESSYVSTPSGTTRNPNQITITRRKDYSKCTDRDKHMLFSYFTAFTSESPRQNFIYSEQNCEHTINAGLVDKVSCRESHVFRPFSDDKSGARTDIQQRLFWQRRQISPYASTRALPLTKTTLKYEEEMETEMDVESAYHNVLTLVDDICQTYEGEHYDNMATHFTSLISYLAKLDEDHLNQLYMVSSQAPCDSSNTVLREMIIDAVPFCNTEDCVIFAAELINKNDVTPSIAKRWLMGFSFTKTATTGMIQALEGVFTSSEIPMEVRTQAYLTTGTLINSVCSAMGETNCWKQTPIRNTMNIFMEKLGSNCRTANTETMNEILVVLRALGNAGMDSYSNTINRCIEENENAMEVRIAAMQTYRRKSCSADRSILRDTFMDRSIDSELRIAAYMNLMQCPTDELIKQVVEMLETETIQQVASFVWSHLTQIQVSKDPLKYYIKQVLKGVDIKNFALDPMKYSRFYEASFFSDALNAGATVDSNLVWSSSSFIPRSGMVNLTLDVFGQAVNLFEIGARVEGVEQMLQEFLEPEVAAKKASRYRRAVDTSIMEIDRQYKEKVTMERNAQGSGYVRVFGNELAYGRTNFNKKMQNEDSKQWLKDFSSKFVSTSGYNYHDDSMLINSVHKIPTGTGFPMTLAFNGSTSIDVTAKGSLLLPRNSGLEINGNLNPRAAVVVRSSMTVDAHITKSGISAESVALTSSIVKAALSIDSDKNLEFSIETPYERNTLLEFKHTLLAITNGEAEEMITNSIYRANRKEVSMCSDDLAGQQLCFYSSYMKDRSSYYNGEASPLFPMDGRFEVSLELVKTDSALSHYLFTANPQMTFEKETDQVPSSAVFSLYMDTPDSNINRKTTAILSYNYPEKEFAIEIERFGVTHFAQGAFKDVANGKQLTLTAQSGENVYNLVSIYQHTVEQLKNFWSIDTTIETPSKSIQSNGEITLDPGRQALFDFSIQNLTPTPIQIKLELQDKSPSSSKLSYSGVGILKIVPYVNTNFECSMMLKPNINNLFFDMRYSFANGRKQSIILNHKRKDSGTSMTSDWQITHKLTSTQFSFINHNIDISHKTTDKVVESNLEISYGSDYEKKNNEHRLQMSHSFKDTSTQTEAHYSADFKLKVPYTRIDNDVAFSYLNGPSSLVTSLQFNADSESPNTISLTLEDLSGNSNLLNKHYALSIPTPWGNMYFNDTIVESPANVYTIDSETRLGEVSGLSFIGQTKLTNLPNQKIVTASISRSDGSAIFTLESDNTYSINPFELNTNNVFSVEGRNQYSFSMNVEQPENQFNANAVFRGGDIDSLTVTAQSRKTSNGCNGIYTIEYSGIRSETTKYVLTNGIGNMPDTLYSANFGLTRNRQIILDANYGIDGQFVSPVKGSVKANLLISPLEIDYEINGGFDTSDGISINMFEKYNDLHVGGTFYLSPDYQSATTNVEQNVWGEKKNISISVEKDGEQLTTTYKDMSTERPMTRTVLVNKNTNAYTFSALCADGYVRPSTCLNGLFRWGEIEQDSQGVLLSFHLSDTSERFNYKMLYNDRPQIGDDFRYKITSNLYSNLHELPYIGDIEKTKASNSEISKTGSSIQIHSENNNRGVYLSGNFAGNRLLITATQNMTELEPYSIPSRIKSDFSLNEGLTKLNLRTNVDNNFVSFVVTCENADGECQCSLDLSHNFRQLLDAGVPDGTTLRVSTNKALPITTNLDLNVATGGQNPSAKLTIQIDSSASASIQMRHNFNRIRKVPKIINLSYEVDTKHIEGKLILGRKNFNVVGRRSRGNVIVNIENTLTSSFPSSISSDVRYNKNNTGISVNSLTTINNNKNYKIDFAENMIQKSSQQPNTIFTESADINLDGRIIKFEDKLEYSPNRASILLSHMQNMFEIIPKSADISLTVLAGEEKGLVFTFSINDQEPVLIDIRHTPDEATLFGNVQLKHNNPSWTAIPRDFTVKMEKEGGGTTQSWVATLSTLNDGDKTAKITIEGPIITPTSFYFSVSLDHEYNDIISELNVPESVYFKISVTNTEHDASGSLKSGCGNEQLNIALDINKETKEITANINHNGNKNQINFNLQHSMTSRSFEIETALNINDDEYSFYADASHNMKLRRNNYKKIGKGSLNSVLKLGNKKASVNHTVDLNNAFWEVTEEAMQDLIGIPQQASHKIKIDLENKGFDSSSMVNVDGKMGYLNIKFYNIGEVRYTLETDLKHDCDELVRYIPKMLNTTATYIMNNGFLARFQLKQPTKEEKTIQFIYEKSDEYTVRLSHNIEKLTEYKISTAMGVDWKHSYENSLANGHIHGYYGDKDARIMWVMKQSGVMAITLTQNVFSEIPDPVVLKITFDESSATCVLSYDSSKSVEISLSKLGDTSGKIKIRQRNVNRDMPRVVSLTGSYSVNSVNANLNIDQNKNAVFSAEFDNTANSVALTFTQNVVEGIADNGKVIAQVNIPAKSIDINGNYGEKEFALNAYVADKIFSVDLTQSFLSSQPTQTHLDVKYDRTNTECNFEVNVKLDEKDRNIILHSNTGNNHNYSFEINYDDYYFISSLEYDTESTQITFDWNMNQNFLDSIPNAITTNEILLFSDEEYSYTFHCTYTGGEPIDFKIKWTPNSESVFGNLNFSHNSVNWESIPNEFSLTVEKIKNGHLSIIGSIDNVRKQLLFSTTGRESQEIINFSTTHDIEFLSDVLKIPTTIALVVKDSATTGDAKLTWGKQNAEFVYTISYENGFSYNFKWTQDICEGAPQIIDVELESTYNIPNNRLSLNAVLNVDNNLYSVGHISRFEDSTITKEIRFIYAEMFLTGKLSLKMGDTKIFKSSLDQNVTPLIPPSVAKEFRFTKTESSVTLFGSFEATRVPRRTVEAIFSQPSASSYQLNINHNLDSWAEYIGRTSAFTFSYRLSSENTLFNMESTMDRISYSASLSYKNTSNVYEFGLVHDIEYMETAAGIPTSLTLILTGLTSGSNSLNVDLQYLLASKNYHWITGFECNKASKTTTFAIDQNIFKKISISSFDLLVPKKFNLEFSELEDGTFQATFTGKARRKLSAIFRHKITTTPNFAWIVSFDNNMKDVLPEGFPQRLRFSVEYPGSWPFNLHLSHDDTFYKLFLSIEKQNGYMSTTYSFNHNSNALTSLNIPKHLSVNETIALNALDYTFALGIDDRVISGTTKGILLNNGANLVVTYNDEPVEMTVSIDVSKSSNNYSVTISGSQNGITDLPSIFSAGTSVNYEERTGMSSFDFFHTIPYLSKTYLIPSMINHRSGGKYNAATKTVMFEYILDVAEVFYAEETFIATLLDNSLTFSGTTSSVADLISIESPPKSVVKYSGECGLNIGENEILFNLNFQSSIGRKLLFNHLTDININANSPEIQIRNDIGQQDVSIPNLITFSISKEVQHINTKLLLSYPRDPSKVLEIDLTWDEQSMTATITNNFEDLQFSKLSYKGDYSESTKWVTITNSLDLDDRSIVSADLKFNNYEREELNEVQFDINIMYMGEEVFNEELYYSLDGDFVMRYNSKINILDRTMKLSCNFNKNNRDISAVYTDDGSVLLSYIASFNNVADHAKYSEKFINNMFSEYVQNYTLVYDIDETKAFYWLSMDDKYIKFVYNQNGNGLFELTHNSKMLATTFMLPREISGVYLRRGNSIDARLTVDPIHATMRFVNNELTTKFYYQETLLLTIDGSYSEQPRHTISGNVRIPPLRSDYNIKLQGEGLWESNANPAVSFILTDNYLRRPRTFEIHMNGEYIEDKRFNVIITSDLEEIEAIDFSIELSHIKRTESCKYSIKFGKYGYEVLRQPRSITIAGTAPETSTLQNYKFESNCKGELTRTLSFFTGLQWNNNKYIRFGSNISLPENNNDIDALLEHSFDFGMNSIRVDYHGSQTTRVKSSHTHITVDGKTMHIATVYRGSLPNIAGPHNLKVEIEHPYDNTFIPSHFVTSGKMTFHNGLYDSNWRITSENVELVTLRKLYRATQDGFLTEFHWKQPFKQFTIKEITSNYAFSPRQPVLLEADVSLNTENKYVPREFKVQSSIDLSDSSCNSKLSITSDQDELLHVSNDITYSENEHTIDFSWKQPYEDLLLTKCTFAVTSTSREGFYLLTSETQINNNEPIKEKYQVTYDIANNGIVTTNTLANVMLGNKEYSFNLDQVWGGTTQSGYKYTYNVRYQLPEGTQFLSVTLPQVQQFNHQIFWRNKNAHIRTTYENSFMSKPVGIDTMYMWDSDNSLFQTAFTGNFSLTREDSDIVTKLSIDTLGNGRSIVYTCDSPLLSIDNLKIRVKYSYGGRILVRIVNGNEDPVEIRGDFRTVFAALRKFADEMITKKFSPTMQLLYGEETTSTGKDYHIGVEINNTPYTLHIVTGSDSDGAFIKMETKEGDDSRKEVAKVLAFLADENTLRIKATGTKLISAFSRVVIHVTGEEVTLKLNSLVENIILLLNSFKTSIEGNHEAVVVIQNKIDTAIAKITDLKGNYDHFVTDLNRHTINIIEDRGDKIENAVRHAISVMEYLRNEIEEIFVGPIKDLTHDYYVQVAEQFIIKIKREIVPVKTALDFINAGDLFVELIEEGVMKIVFYLEKNIEASLTAVREPIAKLVQVTDTELILDVPIYVEIDLDPLPTYSDIVIWIAKSSFANEIDLSVQKLYSLSDDYYRLRSIIYKPYDELIPPFKAHAELTEFKHFRTFDGMLFDFESSCQSTHVLARDFRDGDFTVTLKYGRSPSIGVRSALPDGSMQYIELRSDYAVFNEDENHVNLPFNYEGLTVKRVGEYIYLTTDLGLSVSCNFKQQLCHIDISAFYFGSTAGLAGTFNNEINDEFELPTSIISSEIDEMAVAWSVPGETCRITNTYTGCDVAANTLCESLFVMVTSPLRSCFPVVDPLPYLQMCKKDTCSRTATEPSCAAVATYQRRCHLAGSPVTTPDHCVTCSTTNNDEIYAGQPARTSVSGADVVFVVERSSCMGVRRVKLRQMFDSVHQSLDSAIGNVRYAVIGFGDTTLNEPVSHTFNGDLFKQSTTNTEFNNRDLVNAIMIRDRIASDEQPDVLSAISAATNLPFRAGATRTIILFTCGECSDNSVLSSDIVTSQLQEQNIVLHHFRNEKISAGRAKKVYGYNSDRVFARSDDLDRTDIKVSKSDSCQPLVASTNGSVWNSNMFNKRSITEIVTMIGEEISSSSANTSPQTCRCVIGRYGTPTSVCTA